MNEKNKNGMDGFVIKRRVAGRIDAASTGEPLQAEPVEAMRTAQSSELGKAYIDASLTEIDTSASPLGLKPSGRKGPGARRIIKRGLIILLVIAILIGGYVGVKFILASGRVFNGNLFDLLGTGKELKMDQHGRSNILVFGTSEDDPSHEDAAPDLADSIMVVSIDQNKKVAAMFSVPRDLYVKFGQACISGYEGKINEVYQCSADGASERDGAEAFMSLVGDTFGLDIQYYTHVNYTVLREAVDAVGGITVNIESDDPRGILDRNFDWKCNYSCYFVKLPNGPANLDGEHALALARARNAAGGYGLSRANFDREQNQQKIILALKDKASSAGTLANPVAVTQLMDSLGNNVRTNFDAGEIKTLIGLMNDIKTESIVSINLIAEGEAVLTTGTTSGGASVVRPVAGLYDFSAVRSYVRAKLNADASSSESATIEVLNGSDTVGAAGKKSDELAELGIVVTSVGDTQASDSYGTFKWYDLSLGSKPETKQKLTDALGSSDSGSVLPAGVQSSADFVIIIGNGVN